MSKQTKDPEDPELSKFQREFAKAVGIRQWSMIRERIVPRVMPPLMVGSAFAATLMLNVWEHLPPQGRMAGMIAFAGLALSAPLWNRKTGSPFVSKKDAIRAIDKDIGGEDDIPARILSDQHSTYNRSGEQIVFDAGQKQIWEKWGAEIANQKRSSGFGAYYGGENKSRAPLHLALAFTTACLYPFMGGNLDEKWQTATDWTVPPPPLVYSASITPPDGIEGVRVYTDLMLKEAIENGDPVAVHDHSTLSVVTYDRPANVTVNGAALEAVPDEDRAGDEIYRYEAELTPETETVSIGTHSFSLDIDPDQGPRVTIHDVAPDRNSPGNLRLEYSIADDHGAAGADARIGVPDEDGQVREPALESNSLPTLVLPYE